jgi:thiol-disulfide isomerase/thioredoxin
MPLISEMADGLLFRELHLRAGKPAPNLNVALVSGQNWSLSGQRGKVVIIQFSFNGCGPCEAMYKDLREIQQTHGKHVAILSIMHDEKFADTEEAVSKGKITWNAHWDGFRGPVATRWAVQGFPTVYLFDTNGNLVGPGVCDLRGKELKDMVDQLLK